MSASIIVVLVTCPSTEIADEIAEGLVSGHLAACVNILENVKSVYWWEGRVQKDSEVLLMIKSTKSGFAALSAFVQSIHPYDNPEIVALAAEHVAPKYAAWVTSNIK